MLGIKDPTKFYVKGSKFYQNKQYDEAILIFKTLVIQYPTESKYWFSLASALQGKKEDQAALKAWSMTALLSEEDPYPHYYASLCYIRLDNKKDAAKALAHAKSRIDSGHPLFEKIKNYLNIL